MFESFNKMDENDIENVLPFSFAEEQEKTYKRMVEIIDNFHNENVKAIFLTWTSSTLFGWTMKEVWKKAFPNEKIPEFYFINPKPWKKFQNLEVENKEREDELQIQQKDEQERIKKILINILENDKEAKVGIFDEAFDGSSKHSHFWRSGSLGQSLLSYEMQELGVKNPDDRVILDGLGVINRSSPYQLFSMFSEKFNKSEARKMVSNKKNEYTEEKAIEVFKKVGQEIGERMYKEKNQENKK